jgi:hypothetical protein
MLTRGGRLGRARQSCEGWLHLDGQLVPWIRMQGGCRRRGTVLRRPVWGVRSLSKDRLSASRRRRKKKDGPSLSSLLLTTCFATAAGCGIFLGIASSLLRVDLRSERTVWFRLKSAYEQGKPHTEMMGRERRTYSSKRQARIYMTATRPVRTSPAKRPFHRLNPRKHSVLPVYMGLPNAHQTLNGNPSTMWSIKIPK